MLAIFVAAAVAEGPPQCGPLPRAVALLTGFARPSTRGMLALEKTLGHLARNVLDPLDADLVTVIESDSCAGAGIAVGTCSVEALEAQIEQLLVRSFGRRLRALGIVEAAGVPRTTHRAPKAERSADGLLRAWIKPAARTSRSVRAFDRHGKGAIAQWHKLSEAWRLMEALEAGADGAQAGLALLSGSRSVGAGGMAGGAGAASSSEGNQYGLVIKLRLDIAPSTPMAVCASRDGLSPGIALPLANHARPGSPPVRMVHAMTDWLFWGSRDAMRVATGVWDGLAYFEARHGGVPLPGEEALGPPRREAMRRPVGVAALLSSLRALPPSAFANWLPYHKIESLSIPDMGRYPETSFVPANRVPNLMDVRRAMVANLQAALEAGWEWIDPEQPGASASDGGGAGGGSARRAQPPLRMLIAANAGRPPPGLFVTEQDFIGWLTMHNITVCDFGAGVNGFYSKKGRLVARPTVDDCLRPPALDSVDWPTPLSPPARAASSAGAPLLPAAATGAQAGERLTLESAAGPRYGEGVREGELSQRGNAMPDAAAGGGMPPRAALSDPPAAAAAGAGPAAGTPRAACRPAPAVRVESGDPASGGGSGGSSSGTGSASSTGEALASAPVRRIAICFHGQFLRRTDFPKTVTQILPAAWDGQPLPRSAGGAGSPADGGAGGDAHGSSSGGSPAAQPQRITYHAFVATSTQRSEKGACELLDGRDICARLVSQAGFSYAQCDHVPYDPLAYLRLAAKHGLPARDAARYSLYPHRVLSSFSTMARSLGLARDHAVRHGGDGYGDYYSLIALTRLDVFFHNVKLLPWPAGRSWLADVSAAGVVARRKTHKPQWEDRFIIGRPALMRSLESLPDGAAFTRRFKQLGNLAYPEAQILMALMEARGFRSSNTRGPFFTQFASIEGFKQNKQKFRRNFIPEATTILSSESFSSARGSSL